MNKTDLIKELARQMGVPVVDVKLPTSLWAGDAAGILTHPGIGKSATVDDATRSMHEMDVDWKAKYDELMCDLTDTAISLNDKCAEIDKLRAELAECRIDEWEAKVEKLERELDAKDEKIEDLQCEVREYLQQERPRIMTQNDKLQEIIVKVLKKDHQFWAGDGMPDAAMTIALYHDLTHMLEQFAEANDIQYKD